MGMLVGFKGSVEKIDLNGKTLEDFSHNMLQELKPGKKKYKLDKWRHKTYTSALLDTLIDVDNECFTPFALVEDNLYKFSNIKVIKYENNFIYKVNKDKSVDFQVGFDTSHFGLPELIPEIFKK